MKYIDLLNKLKQLPAERLQDDAILYVTWDSEYIPIKALWQSGIENDILDENHPYLVI
jgi:hypothetical protein